MILFFNLSLVDSKKFLLRRIWDNVQAQSNVKHTFFFTDKYISTEMPGFKIQVCGMGEMNVWKVVSYQDIFDIVNVIKWFLV